MIIIKIHLYLGLIWVSEYSFSVQVTMANFSIVKTMVVKLYVGNAFIKLKVTLSFFTLSSLIDPEIRIFYYRLLLWIRNYIVFLLHLNFIIYELSFKIVQIRRQAWKLHICNKTLLARYYQEHLAGFKRLRLSQLESLNHWLVHIFWNTIYSIITLFRNLQFYQQFLLSHKQCFQLMIESCP